MAATKSKSGAKSKAAPSRIGPVPPYGDPIREAIAGGDLRNMKAVAARARKHLAEVEGALKKLDGAIKKAGG
jgi:hypothetical protein